jgi:hypothetical protein
MIYRTIVLSLALCCLSLTGWTAERFPFLGEVTSDKVSIRAGYNVAFERLDIVPKGTNLVVLDKQYEWYKVQLPPSAKAYVRVDYVKLLNNKVGEITADRLNIRAGKGINYSPVGQLRKGTRVRLVSKFDDWFQIEPVEGLYGWISKDFLKLKSNTVPPLDQLGLSPVGVGVESPVEQNQPAPAEKVQISGAPVVADGVIQTVPADIVVKNVQYQFVTQDNAVYFLKADPALLKNFTHKVVRLEGEPVSDVSSLLPHPVLVIKKFNLVL